MREPGNLHAGHGHGHRHGHGHGLDLAPGALNPRASRVLWPVVVLCAVATVLGAAVLWPRGDVEFDDPLQLDADPVAAEVVRVEVGPCSYAADLTCEVVAFEVTGGPTAGDTGEIEFVAGPNPERGDSILLTAFPGEGGELVYSFYEYQRSSQMWWLLGLFVLAVLALGRWRGLGALAGLAFSLVTIVVFSLPAVLDGRNALAVALVTSGAIAFAALFLAHGRGIGTAVALVSTFASLLLTAILAWLFVGATNLTGLADDSSLLLGGLAGGIDARGILLAGIVIGSLGVLDDVTVTQVSAVWQLKQVRPELRARGLFAPALQIGRDHISSTVNTLFLAYAGAALPLLLLFTEAGQSLGSVVTREIVATEVVRALVGSIGLVAAVPISTAIAAWVASPPRPELVDEPVMTLG